MAQTVFQRLSVLIKTPTASPHIKKHDQINGQRCETNAQLQRHKCFNYLRWFSHITQVQQPLCKSDECWVEDENSQGEHAVANKHFKQEQMSLLEKVLLGVFRWNTHPVKLCMRDFKLLLKSPWWRSAMQSIRRCDIYILFVQHSPRWSRWKHAH